MQASLHCLRSPLAELMWTNWASRLFDWSAPAAAGPTVTCPSLSANLTWTDGDIWSEWWLWDHKSMPLTPTPPPFSCTAAQGAMTCTIPTDVCTSPCQFQRQCPLLVAPADSSTPANFTETDPVPVSRDFLVAWQVLRSAALGCLAGQPQRCLSVRPGRRPPAQMAVPLPLRRCAVGGVGGTAVR